MPSSRILSIDYGLKRIGFAISDERKVIAMPLHTMFAEKKLEKTVLKVAQELEAIKQRYGCEIAEIIVGLPLMMSGKIGFLADEVNYFIQLLKKKISIPIKTWDERLTSVQAERSMREGGINRKKRSQIVDSVAAIIILQSYLDSRGNEIPLKDLNDHKDLNDKEGK